MFTLPQLSYAYSALEPYLDTETMKIHHDGHHAAYVKNLNDALENYPNLQKLTVEELLRSLEKIPEEIRTKVKNNAGGHYNHSVYWPMLAPPKGFSPEGKMLQAITGIFDSFTNFQAKFTQAGLTRFGSGWIWLLARSGRLEIVDTPNQDSPISEGRTPILALDVWEHAYYLKYRNKRVDYISAWWNVVNWQKISKNFELQTRPQDQL